jgi:hypothetical protein
LSALNEFIAEAQRNLAAKELVMIADNLDRIVPTTAGKMAKPTTTKSLSTTAVRCVGWLQCDLHGADFAGVLQSLVAAAGQLWRHAHVLPMVMVRRQRHDSSVGIGQDEGIWLPSGWAIYRPGAGARGV